MHSCGGSSHVEEISGLNVELLGSGSEEAALSGLGFGRGEPPPGLSLLRSKLLPILGFSPEPPAKPKEVKRKISLGWGVGLRAKTQNRPRMQPVRSYIRLEPTFSVRDLGKTQAGFTAFIVLAFVLMAPRMACQAQTTAQAGGQRGFTPQTSETDSQGGSYYALVVGINQYGPPLPSLKTAVNDAQAIARVLSESYGFQVKLLVDSDATRSNILNAMDQYRRSLRENDSLLIYYAGHGYLDREADKAYWLPVDAEAQRTTNWIIADELTTDIRVQPARHVLIVSDSCYSGGLARDPGIRVRPDDKQVFLSKMLSRKSRNLMASGGFEPVSDSGADGHSVFANAFLGALSGTAEDAFAAADLFYGFVQPRVAGKSNQIPQYELLRNSDDESGDFVFVRSKSKSAGRIEPHGAPAAGSQPRTKDTAADTYPVLEASTGGEIHIDQQQLAAKGDFISDQDKAAIGKTLNRYAEIFTKRKAKGLKEVWPTVPAGTISTFQSFIDSSKNLNLSIVPRKWEPHGTGILVTCEQTQSFERNGKQTSQEGAINFYMVKSQGAWIISDIPVSSD
jgi:Caspase domain